MRKEELARFMYCLSQSGYAVIDGFVEPDRLKFLKSEVTKFEREIYQFQKRTGAVGLSHGWPLITTRCLYCISEEVQKLAISPIIQKIAQSYLGGAIIRDCLLQTNMPDPRGKMRGGNQTLSFHRDTLWKEEEIVPSYLHAFILLTDFTRKNGATFVVPGTHLKREPGYYFKHTDPGFREAGVNYLVYHRSYFSSATQILAPAGSLIFLDPMAVHAQGTNMGATKRHLINITFRNDRIKGNPPLLDARAIAETYSRVPVNPDFIKLLENDPSLPNRYGPFGYSSENENPNLRNWEKIIR